MSRIIQASVTMRPTSFMRSLGEHQNVTEGDKHIHVATRMILGRQVKFFADGRHEVNGVQLAEEEQATSRLLQLAYASICEGRGCGHRQDCWVNASAEPTEVWIKGRRIRQAEDVLPPPDRLYFG